MKSEQVLSSTSLRLPGSSRTMIILTHTLLLFSILAAQPKDRVEFQVCMILVQFAYGHRFTSSDYYKKVVILTDDHLDEENNLNLNMSLNPIPDEEKPKIFSKGTMTSRAKTFFWKGNIFYHLESIDSTADHNASRIVINKIRTDKTPQGELLIWINGQEMNPLLCYVPQEKFLI